MSSLHTYQHVTQQYLLVGELESLILSIVDSNTNLSDSSCETHLEVHVLKQNDTQCKPKSWVPYLVLLTQFLT